MFSGNTWPEIHLSDSPGQALANALARIKQNGYDILTDRKKILETLLYYTGEINHKLEWRETQNRKSTRMG